MTDYIEVTVCFVIPAGTAVPFVNMLERAVFDNVFPRLTSEEFYYYGVWQDEWLSTPPRPEEAVAFSKGIEFSREKNISTPIGALEQVHEDLSWTSYDSREALIGYITDAQELIRSVLEKFSREKSTSDVRSPDEQYQMGYLAGFEAGGGDVVDHGAKMNREIELARDKFFQSLSFRAWYEKFSREKSDDSSSEAVDPR